MPRHCSFGLIELKTLNIKNGSVSLAVAVLSSFDCPVLIVVFATTTSGVE